MNKPLIAATLLTASLASAQAPAADLEQLWPEPGGRGGLLAGNGQALPAGGFRLGVAGFLTRGSQRSLVRSRAGLQLSGAVGVLDWLELGANVPVLVSQQGTPALALASAGLGNPWLHAKVGLLDGRGPLSAAVVVGVGVPVGTAAAQGNGGLEWSPRLQVGRVFERVQVGAELGLLHRPAVELGPPAGGAGEWVGSQVSLAAMIATLTDSGPRGELTLRAHVALAGGPPGVEAQLGFRVPLGPVELFASVGPGVGGPTTTPMLRAFAGVAFANVPMASPARASPAPGP